MQDAFTCPDPQNSFVPVVTTEVLIGNDGKPVSTHGFPGVNFDKSGKAPAVIVPMDPSTIPPVPIAPGPAQTNAPLPPRPAQAGRSPLPPQAPPIPNAPTTPPRPPTVPVANDVRRTPSSSRQTLPTAPTLAPNAPRASNRNGPTLPPVVAPIMTTTMSNTPTTSFTPQLVRKWFLSAHNRSFVLIYLLVFVISSSDLGLKG